MKNSLLLFLGMSCIQLCQGEDFYYRLTTSNLQDGSHYQLYVKSDLSPMELSVRIEQNKAILFPETYAWMGKREKWGTWKQWDSLFSGEVIISGSQIIMAQKLTGCPLDHQKDEQKADKTNDKSNKEDKAKDF